MMSMVVCRAHAILGMKRMMESIADRCNFSLPWYHGSPLHLERLHVGSSITQDRDLARVFSHKPSLVSKGTRSIKHSGEEPGYLYRVIDEIGPKDAYPHPRTTMEPGQEWLTRRELRVELIGQTAVCDHERLNVGEVAELHRRLEAQAERDEE